ncbi:MAG: aldo/keto reductase [Clostridium perfringens]|nr:aldo/keto reductase [Clostridium perfringens]
MKYRKFANTNIELSAIGLGCMGMSMSYGERNNEESLKTLRHSIELGINFWDTADIYGAGDNEELLSKVLVENRDKIFIATKVGFRAGNDVDEGKEIKNPQATYLDGSPKHIREGVEKSLKRLKIDCIDLLYLHRVDPNVSVEESVREMAKLVKEGKVKYLGLSECTPEDLKKAHKIHPISAVQSEYSILYREVEKEILPLTKELGITFVPFAPFGRGLIANKIDVSSLKDNDFRKNLPRYNGEYLENNQKLINEFADYAKSRGITPAQLAVAWVLAQGDNIIPIPGTKKTKYLEENIKAVDVTLNEDDIKAIEALINKYPNVGERYAARESKFIKK